MRLRRLKDDDGQAIILVALAMSMFLILALGLSVDGAHLYAQRQMAQTAADAAAVAGVMSVFAGTTSAPTTGFPTTGSFTCTTTDTRTPCSYANKNGFGGSASDTVTIDFPANTAAPGVTFSPTYPVTLIRATVQRNVSTTLMRLFPSSAATSTVKATAMAGIVSVVGPVSILVTHPTLANSFNLQGTPTITICGGPARSIQVNSSSSTAANTGGNASIDLSHAGPPDPGNCSTGTGADLGVWGGPASSPSASYGTTGKYVQPASPIQDPLAGVSPPAVPTNTGAMGTHSALANGVSGCPASPKKACELYSPGLYTTGIDGKNSTPVFKPGIYYIQANSGMACAANCDMYMGTSFTDTGAGTTNTGWTGNMMVYNTGPSGNPTNAGAFNLGANGTINLVGSPSNSSYKGILFFQDHSSVAQSHSLGGGGAMTLVGTIYLTNTRSTMQTTPADYQALTLQGGSGSGTQVQGNIIVGTLQLGGNGSITMNLNSNAFYIIDRVALIN